MYISCGYLVDFHFHSLTTEENSERDPFVDSEWRLDFSRASGDDGGHYRCTAVDERGATAGHVFFVEITHDRKSKDTNI